MYYWLALLTGKENLKILHSKMSMLEIGPLDIKA